jgi:ABC-2 type transport system ATP-binding protein
VLFSSHIVSDVERLANIIWILKGGQLFWQGDLDTLKESVIRVHLGAASAARLRPKFHRVIGERSINGSSCILVALRSGEEDWSSLEELTGPGARVERLGLEDIFLELHA